MENNTIERTTIPIWDRKAGLRAIAPVPDNFLREFAQKHPESVRKFGRGNKNGTLLFRVADVLAEIEKIGG